jgi:hypothetical protein
VLKPRVVCERPLVCHVLYSAVCPCQCA